MFELSKLSPPMVVTDALLSSATAIDIVGAAYTNSYLGATSTKQIARAMDRLRIAADEIVPVG